MGINHELMFIILFVIEMVGFIILCVKSKQIYDLWREIESGTARYNVLVSKLNDVQYTLNRNTDQLCRIEDNVDQLFEEAEEEDELEPGEVETCGELTIEIEEDPIHLITPNQFFFENNGHSQFKLEYASDCDELRFYYNDFSDEHIVIDNIDQCIGDGLKFFGVNSKNDDVVYVRNNVFNADFMITKVS